MYPLDTNGVSELRKPKPRQGVVAWIQNAWDETLHLSTVTIAEIQAGIEITREQDVEKANEIEAWLNSVAEMYNIIPADAHTLRRLAQLLHRRPKQQQKKTKSLRCTTSSLQTPTLFVAGLSFFTVGPIIIWKMR